VSLETVNEWFLSYYPTVTEREIQSVQLSLAT
jgi:hypothetical protein